MQRITLHVEMRCNNYCVYCGSRAIDPVMIEKRVERGLRVPSPRKPGLDHLVRRVVRAGRRAIGLRTTALQMVRGWELETFTLEAAVEAIEAARADGADALSLQGGEPSIWPPVLELVEHARRLGFREIQMVTNGRRLADAGFARRVIGAGLTHLVFSVLGHDEDTHDGVTLVPGSHAAVMQAIAHCADARAAAGTKLSLSCNLITSAETYAALPEQISRLAALGIDAVNIHMVRFEGFGDDPKLRERFAFPIDRVRAPLAAALREGRRVGLAVVADDVPLCLHPFVAGSAVRGVIARQASENLHLQSPLSSFMRKDTRPKRMPAPCEQCLLTKPCGFVPAEYVPARPGDAFRPITADSIAASIAAEPDGTAGDEGRVEEMAGAIDALREDGLLAEDDARRLFTGIAVACERMVDAAIAVRRTARDARARLDVLEETLGRIAGLADALAHAKTLERAIERGHLRVLERAAAELDEPEAIRALQVLLRLRPWSEHRSGDALVRAKRPFADLARELARGGSSAVERALVFGSGHRVVIGGPSLPDGAVDVVAVRAAPLEGPAEMLDALFVVHVLGELRDARRLRCDGEQLEIDRGAGWTVLYRGREPGSLRWEPA